MREKSFCCYDDGSAKVTPTPILSLPRSFRKFDRAEARDGLAMAPYVYLAKEVIGEYKGNGLDQLALNMEMAAALSSTILLPCFVNVFHHGPYFVFKRAESLM